MESAYYEVTYRREPTSAYSKMSVYCHGEYEAIADVKSKFPNAVIIDVKKR